MLVRRLQSIAQRKSIRMTFVSGDVHVGGLGRLYSHPKVDLRTDFRFMPQVTTSSEFLYLDLTFSRKATYHPKKSTYHENY